MNTCTNIEGWNRRAAQHTRNCSAEEINEYQNRFYAWNENEKKILWTWVRWRASERVSGAGRDVKMVRRLRLLNIRWWYITSLMGKGVRILNCFSCYLQMCLSESHQIGFMLSVHEVIYWVSVCVCVMLYAPAACFVCHPNNSKPTIGKGTGSQKKPMREKKRNSNNTKRELIWIDT